MCEYGDPLGCIGRPQRESCLGRRPKAACKRQSHATQKKSHFLDNRPHLLIWSTPRGSLHRQASCRAHGLRCPPPEDADGSRALMRAPAAALHGAHIAHLASRRARCEAWSNYELLVGSAAQLASTATCLQLPVGPRVLRWPGWLRFASGILIRSI